MNGLLAALSRKAYTGLGLEKIQLELGQILCEPLDVESHVYFPNDSLISLVAVAAGGKPLEVGMVGREGMLGVSAALGAGRSPARALVQGAGTAMRMTARAFRAELGRNARLRSAAARYADVSMGTAMMIAACNNAHALDKRCARWLLMLGDALSRPTFYLTQQFLADMLGVRRAGVNDAASGLQRRGLIAYRRGTMTIRDRAGLTAASCGCYANIRALSAS